MITKVLDSNIEPTRIVPHHRFNSWQYCYEYFAKNHSRLNEDDVQDNAALHLGFYLASWGMMRGSTELLQKDYRIHLKFIKTIAANPKYHVYYSTKHRETLNEEMIEPLFELIELTRECYREFDSAKDNQQRKMEISNTLVSKILLGVFGNIPAYDRFFVSALKSHEFIGSLNVKSILQIIQFFDSNKESFAPYLSKHYTPMKLIDMYFWQVGFSNFENSKPNTKLINTTKKYINESVQRSSHISQTDEVRKYITELLDSKKTEGLKFIELRSGDIHAALKMSERLPSVCDAMNSLPYYNNYETIKSPPKGKGSNLILRYHLE